jgi:predicted enzyme related to lactoylglutathione lyase
MKVKLGVISVQDYDRAIDFYTAKLGFTVVTDAKFGEDGRWIELEIPESDTRVALFTPPGKAFEASPCSNIVFGCDDIDAKYQELLARGVEFVQIPQKESWGMSSLFKDSEGNVFCLSQDF